MKRILLYILLLTGSISVAHAQEGPEDPGKKAQNMKALYVAYVTQQLNLTETEAQKFWPLHAQFDAEIKSVSLDLPELERQQKNLDIKKKYLDRFANIIGSPRSNKFYKLKDEFTKKLVDHMRNRQQNNMNQRPGRRKNF